MVVVVDALRAVVEGVRIEAKLEICWIMSSIPNWFRLAHFIVLGNLGLFGLFCIGILKLVRIHV